MNNLSSIRKRALPLCVLLVFGAAGCGQKSASVTGKVTYRGTPLASGTVVFVGPDGTTAGTGMIMPDGTYSVPKAPVGAVKAAVQSPPPPGAYGGPQLVGSPQDEEVKAAWAVASRYVAIPPQAGNPQQSGLSYQLKPGRNTVEINLP
jgi:hypothetical protein